MQWLRRCTLLVSIGLGLSVLALVIHTFWVASQPNPPLLSQRIQDLQILVIILLALSSLYTVVFLLSPSVSDRILRQQAEQTVRAVKTQLARSVEELREVKEEFRRIMLGNEKLARQLRWDAAGESPKAKELPKEMPEATAPPLKTAASMDGDEQLNRAISLTSDTAAAGELRYSRGCLLASQGDLEKASREIQMAFLNKSPDLEQRLARDTEEGGPLYELASREPYDQVILDLLMNVSIGA
ncbi:MAG: hypothetical protein M3Y27_06590 [Acidobacteriota bacterium]|nr:hypothetical protein [Acidobacteriota bacterium]